MEIIKAELESICKGFQRVLNIRHSIYKQLSVITNQIVIFPLGNYDVSISIFLVANHEQWSVSLMVARRGVSKNYDPTWTGIYNLCADLELESKDLSDKVLLVFQKLQLANLSYQGVEWEGFEEDVREDVREGFEQFTLMLSDRHQIETHWISTSQALLQTPHGSLNLHVRNGQSNTCTMYIGIKTSKQSFSDPEDYESYMNNQRKLLDLWRLLNRTYPLEFHDDGT